LICRWPPLTALPASRARGQPTESAAGDPAPRNVVAPGCRTGRGTYSRTRLMRFTQDRRPTCSRARIASYTVPLAQPAASAIASYDGEALAGRGVVQAPEQRGEHRQRLRADLAVGPCLSPGGASGRATIITRTLALRSSGTRRPGPKTFSRGPMPRCDLERAVGAFALCGLGLPVSAWPAWPWPRRPPRFRLRPGRRRLRGITVPLSDASRPRGQATRSAASQRLRKQVGLMIPRS
jgi:hypothetical protein